MVLCKVPDSTRGWLHDYSGEGRDWVVKDTYSYLGRVEYLVYILAVLKLKCRLLLEFLPTVAKLSQYSQNSMDFLYSSYKTTSPHHILPSQAGSPT